MIYLEKPELFENPLEVVGCFVEHNGKILLLERHPNKPEALTYGAPGGKVDITDPSREHSMSRELFEETGIQVSPDNFKEKVLFYVTHDDTKRNYLYHNYRVVLDTLPEVRLNPGEHTQYVWVAPNEAMSLPLIFDEDNCIQHFYGIQ